MKGEIPPSPNSSQRTRLVLHTRISQAFSGIDVNATRAYAITPAHSITSTIMHARVCVCVCLEKTEGGGAGHVRIRGERKSELEEE